MYRGTAPNPTVALIPDLGVVTSFLDSGRTNGQIYYYKVTALNAIGESAASNETNATPSDLVLPVEPLSILDTFNRANENPLSVRVSLGERHSRAAETKLSRSSRTNVRVHRNDDAHCLAEDAARPGLRESMPRSQRFPGTETRSALYVRLQTPGSAAVDGYMLLIDSGERDRPADARPSRRTAHRHAAHDGQRRSQLEISFSFARRERLSRRGCERGTTWNRASRVNDSTYTGAGYAGIGIRGKTGRLDDFGAR